MATREYLAVDGDWNNTANWSGGAVPVNGDSVVIATDSDQDLDENLNQSAVTVVDLFVGGDWRGDLGALANTLRINVSGTLAFGGKGQTAYIDGTLAEVVVNSLGGVEDALHLDGTITTLVNLAPLGYVTVDSGAALTTARMMAPGGRLIVESGVTGLTDLTAAGGITELNSACTNARIGGGQLKRKTGQVTLLELFEQGELIDLAGEDIVTYNQFGGIFDGRLNTNPDVDIQTGTVFKGVTYLNNSVGTYKSFTNDLKVYGGAAVYAANELNLDFKL